MIRVLTSINKYTTGPASSLASLSKVWSRTDSIKTSFLNGRRISSSYHNYSIPAGGYPDGIGDEYNPSFLNCRPASRFGYEARNGGFLDGRSYGDENFYRAYGDEFGGSVCHVGNWNVDHCVGPCWRNYVDQEDEYCPHSREACYWETNVGRLPGVRGNDYGTHWINGDARWNRHALDVCLSDGQEWNVQPQMTRDYCGDMVGGRPYGENLSGFQPIFSVDYTEHWKFSPDLYPYQQNTGWFCNDGGGELQGNEQPVNPNWINGKCHQTWGTYYTEHDGDPIPSSRTHWSNYGLHWNDATARQNQQLQDVYGLHGYDQNARSQSSMDYNHNTVTESSHLERNDVRFQGEPQQNSSSIPSGSGRLLQGNGPEHLCAIRERCRQNCDGNKWKNVNAKPQSYTSDYPDRSYSENKNGFQKNVTEGGSNLDGHPITGGPHNAQYNSFRNNEIFDGAKVKNNPVNFEYQENRDGDKWGNVQNRPQKFTVKEQPAKMTDRSGQLHQIPLTYHQAGNEATRHSQRHLGIINTDNSKQQQPHVKSSSYMQKMDRDQHRAQQQNSEWDFLGETEPTPSPTLSAAHLDVGPQVVNCESSVENLEPEKFRGTVEELVSFTKDGKLTLAVKVLDVMEKKKQRLDPERDMCKVKMLIRACGASKAVSEAKAVHKHIVNLMSPLKFSIHNKILDMYLKCGAIADAYSMFYNMAAHNLTSWDIMIKGLVKNNLGEEALDVFAEFKNTESEPDGPMFLGVFSACRLVGDVTEGMLHFESMTKHYGITASMKHYISMVEMMGHAGYLDEAMEFIEKMPVEPSVDVWETMMNVCRIQGNTELGDRCAEVVQVLDPTRLSEESKAGLIPIIASILEKDKNETEVGLIP